MDTRFFHGIVVKKERLTGETSRLVIFSYEEGKLTAFSKEKFKRNFLLFEGGYYLLGADSFRNNTVKEWELIECFANTHQLAFIQATQEVIERYFPNRTGRKYFPFFLSALRRIDKREALIKNYTWFLAILARKEGWGRILPEHIEKTFILHRRIDEKELKDAFKRAIKIQKEMTR